MYCYWIYLIFYVCLCLMVTSSSMPKKIPVEWGCVAGEWAEGFFFVKLNGYLVNQSQLCCGLRKRGTKWFQANNIYWRSRYNQSNNLSEVWPPNIFLWSLGSRMEVVGDMVTVQQNERSNEEEEREREREEATPSADIERATEIEKKKSQEERLRASC